MVTVYWTVMVFPNSADGAATALLAAEISAAASMGVAKRIDTAPCSK
jgi:hypothetical protein